MEQNQVIIGMDLGGTFLKYALGYPDGRLIYKKKRPSHGTEKKEKVFAAIFKAIDVLLKIAREKKLTVVAIGFGSPGAVDFDNGRLLGSTPNLPYWGNANIRGEIKKKYNIPLWADNDANVMALAETRQGAAKGYSHVIALTLGTGIGGGIVIDNKIYRGVGYAGAELGHMSIDYNGLACNCGGTGCIEIYASASGMVRNYIDKLNKNNKTISQNLTTEVIFDRFKDGESEATQVIDETCVYLGSALASITNIFNPQIIVIGGGVADAGDEFLRLIWNVLEERAMKAALKGLKMVRAKLGNDAGMVGAISLASDYYFGINCKK